MRFCLTVAFHLLTLCLLFSFALSLSQSLSLLLSLPLSFPASPLSYDLLQCHLDRSGECVINEDDIDEAFDRVRELKYSQRYSLSGCWLLAALSSVMPVALQVCECSSPHTVGWMSVGVCGGADLGEGITITPYCAGHSLGGAVWKLQKDTDEIVYLNSCNHLKEK